MNASRRIAAFFDIDGTLLPAPSLELRFASWLLATELISSWQVASWGAVSLANLLTGEAGAFSRNKSYLAGLPPFLVQRWQTSLTPGALQPYPQAASRMIWHLDQKHTVLLVSGTLLPLAEVFAAGLGKAIGVRASNLEVIDGHFTGLLAAAHMSGREKACALKEMADEYDISLGASYAYGDHINDLQMLESVGNPTVVNPGIRLERIAKRRGWPVATWNVSRSPASTPQAALSTEEAR